MGKKSPPPSEDDRRLESPQSQAAQTPAARHGDALSPSQALAESVNAEGSQRVGSSSPVANPVTSFPERPTGEPGVNDDERRDHED